MNRISFTMNPDNEGKITVTSIIKYIIQNMPQIAVPNTDITTIPLTALTLVEDNTKHCIEGYVEGISLHEGKYAEYQFTLIFS